MKARRIAVLLQSLDGGGAQRRTVELANGFVAQGRAVDLLLVEPGDDLQGKVASAVRITRLGSDPICQLADYLKREQPDALLAGAAAIHDIAVAAVAKHPGTPLILRASSHPLRHFPWSMPRQRLRELFRRRARLRRYAAADLIIAVAADVGEALRRALPSARVEVIANPVVNPAFLADADAAIKLPWPPDETIPLIVGIGRFALAKDFPTLIRAFGLLRETRPAHLAILGDGSPRERAALEKLVRRFGLEADIALPGVTPHVAAWLSRANLFVSSSLWEGSPGALIEALAMGCPVVATNSVGTARDLLADPRLGALVPPSDPRAMAKAMAAVLDRPVNRAALVAAAKPFATGGRAADNLAAIDRCVAGRRE